MRFKYQNVDGALFSVLRAGRDYGLQSIWQQHEKTGAAPIREATERSPFIPSIQSWRLLETTKPSCCGTLKILKLDPLTYARDWIRDYLTTNESVKPDDATLCTASRS